MKLQWQPTIRREEMTPRMLEATLKVAQLAQDAAQLAQAERASGIPASQAVDLAAGAIAAREARRVSPAERARTNREEKQAVKPLDNFFNKNRRIFESRGYTRRLWDTLTLEQKSALINAVLPTGKPIPIPIIPPSVAPEMPQITYPIPSAPTPPTYTPSAPVETPMIPDSAAAQQVAEAIRQVDAFYAANQEFFTNFGYPPEKWNELSLGQKNEVVQSAIAQQQGVPQAGSTPAQEAATPVEFSSAYELWIEGNLVGNFSNLDDASKSAIQMTTPGDRFEVIYNKQSTGLRIRTTTGSVDVPPDIDAQVRAMPREKMGQFVSQAEKKTEEGAGVPWWLILGGGAAAAAAIL